MQMKFSSKIYHQLNYIYWRYEASFIKLSQTDFKNKYFELRKNRSIIKYTTIRDTYSNETVFAMKTDGNYKMIFLKEKGKYVIYSTNDFDNSKNSLEMYQGSKSIKKFKDKFEQDNNISLYKAFGTVEEDFKRCVPKQFYYLNKNYLNKELVASSLDACSQYPSSMCGRLPDSHTMIEMKGRVEPNKEYPFAFYKSGHVAEYNVFDTHNWTLNPYFNRLFRFGKEKWSIEPCIDEEEVTYLMKASDYTFDDTWQYFYDKRGFDTEAKLVMNSAIGMMHTHKYDKYKYAHLVAVAIARGNQKILDMCERIGYKNIIQICVDGILYIGREYGVDYKKLGVFNQEFTNCELKVSNFNKYIAMKDGKCIKAKHGNCNVNVIPDEQITNLDEQYNWVFINPLEGVEYEESL